MQELTHLTNSFSQLRQAQAKFKSCIENVAEIKPVNKGVCLSQISSRTRLINQLGKTILVPLTNSLYVPGKLSDAENVIVDVGTGYYVKKVCLTLDRMSQMLMIGRRRVYKLWNTTKPKWSTSRATWRRYRRHCRRSRRT